jgi:hyaluronoglucosaminidase
MFDNDPETYYHSGEAQRTDHFVGVDMGIVREVREIRIIQGRNSVDDVDYFDHCILEYSKDGETWVALTEPMEGVYEIEWNGEPFEARYVGIRKLESKKRNWLAIRSFEINPVAEADFGWDANPFTFVKVEGSIVVDIMSGCYTENGEKSLELMLGELGDKVEYRIYNDFADYSRGEITSSRASIELPMTDIVSGQWRIELKGNFDLYELFYK